MALSETVRNLDHLDDERQNCVTNCLEAATVCEWCADECLGDADMETCARRCRDVADLTSLHARGSNYSTTLAEACADACEECASECERHDADHCRQCADVLRECAEACRSMAA